MMKKTYCMMMRRVILGRSNESTNTVDSDLQLITLIQINANLILRTLVYEYIYFFYMIYAFSMTLL